MHGHLLPHSAHVTRTFYRLIAFVDNLTQILRDFNLSEFTSTDDGKREYLEVQTFVSRKIELERVDLRLTFVKLGGQGPLGPIF